MTVNPVSVISQWQGEKKKKTVGGTAIDQDLRDSAKCNVRT